MSDERKKRIAMLAEELYETCENHDDAHTIDSIDALTLTIGHMIKCLEEGARNGVIEGVCRNLKRQAGV